MATPRKKPVRKAKKTKGKIKVKKSVKLRKKGATPPDTVPVRPPADVSPTFKIKIRKK